MTEPSRPARLWYQSFVHPIEQAPYISRLQHLLDAAASPGIQFDVHGLDPPDRLFHPLTEFRCAAQTIRNALEAERAGYDAFVIGHFQEPGLLEIRGALDIPVVGLGEATLLQHGPKPDFSTNINAKCKAQAKPGPCASGICH